MSIIEKAVKSEKLKDPAVERRTRTSVTVR
jgi:hypothetical protein